MCGLAGAFFFTTRATRDPGLSAVLAMCGRMRARGPDAEGVWADPGANVTLGHRRLAIIDLDERSNQPLASADGRHVIVFNGEIYNFRELRAELDRDGVPLRTCGDTEVILELYRREGAAMLPRLRGMFAFAIWDRLQQEVFLARDPYGIKPLYVANVPGGVLIASQVKALLATGLVSREPDPEGQAGFWLMGSVPEPRTWFRDIRAVRAGHHVTIGATGTVATRSWSDIGDAWRGREQAVGSLVDVRDKVRTALVESVRAHLVADVPIGVFLSGGIDSGGLAALMSEAGATNLQAITLVFREFNGSAQDESPAAARIAQRYGVAHHLRDVNRSEFETDLPRILEAMDQPSIDGINTWYASKAVAELGLKVVVSGVGGDELFQGYTTFAQLPRLVSLWRNVSKVPGAVHLARRVAALQARRSRNPRWKLLPALLLTVEGAWFARRSLFSPEELPKLMGDDLVDELAARLDPASIVRGMTGALACNSRLALGQIESMTYLRNQLLRDSDWASMDHSVELRTPLVDWFLLREVQAVLGNFERFPRKQLLAYAPKTPLASDTVRRTKTGFGIPVQHWLAQLGRTDPEDAVSRGWARQLVKGIYAV